MNFGMKHRVVALAETGSDLYDAALAPSSEKTYKTGQRAYFRFVQELERYDASFPFKKRCLSETELQLAFFMASLLLKGSITSTNTILSY